MPFFLNNVLYSSFKFIFRSIRIRIARHVFLSLSPDSHTFYWYCRHRNSRCSSSSTGIPRIPCIIRRAETHTAPLPSPICTSYCRLSMCQGDCFAMCTAESLDNRRRKSHSRSSSWKVFFPFILRCVKYGTRKGGQYLSSPSVFPANRTYGTSIVNGFPGLLCLKFELLLTLWPKSGVPKRLTVAVLHQAPRHEDVWGE
jgi:hypothetical protein